MANSKTSSGTTKATSGGGGVLLERRWRKLAPGEAQNSGSGHLCMDTKGETVQIIMRDIWSGASELGNLGWHRDQPAGAPVAA